jgi:hypothetical protein
MMRSGDGTLNVELLHQMKVFLNLIYMNREILKFSATATVSLTSLHDKFDRRLTQFLCTAGLGGSWKDKCSSNMAIGKDMIFNHFDVLFSSDICPYGHEEFKWIRHCLCTIFACCLLPAENVTPKVRRRVEAACVTYYSLVLDLIVMGIYTEDEMVNLYFVQVGIVIARCFGSQGCMVMRESIAEVQECFWKKLRTYSRDMTAHGGGLARKKPNACDEPLATSPATTTTAKAEPTFDPQPITLEVAARYDIHQLYEQEHAHARTVGARSVAGINKRCGPRWLHDHKVLEDEFVIPACMFDDGRTLAKTWDTVVEVMRWGAEAYTKDAASGNCVIHCSDSATPRMPAIVQTKMTVCAATREVETLHVDRNGDGKVLVYWAGTRTIRRTNASGGVLESHVPLPERHLCATGAAKNEVRALCEHFYRPVADGGVAATKPCPLPGRAKAWRAELYMLVHTHGWEAIADTGVVTEKVAGSAATAWPLALQGHTSGEALVIDDDANDDAGHLDAAAVDAAQHAQEQSGAGELYRIIMAARELGVGRVTRSGRRHVPQDGAATAAAAAAAAAADATAADAAAADATAANAAADASRDANAATDADASPDAAAGPGAEAATRARAQRALVMRQRRGFALRGLTRTARRSIAARSLPARPIPNVIAPM